MTCRVVITGMGWRNRFWQRLAGSLVQTVAVRKCGARRCRNGKSMMGYRPCSPHRLMTSLLPVHYTRKRIRAMGRVSRLATRATELALEQAGLIDDPVLTGGETGIAYGSSTRQYRFGQRSSPPC
ncbi:3-oxoacyl-(acyl carrier protein) synthase II [Kluyvera cryocrescens]|uniref:3-oxoacyl-(Acyl carrier protein) synthase II n=1 Tax=Kluyvera cryocrescens TaxID=580 RepID=A0A485CGA3_KLUCR|nr:3-oxoacyl-(acyl carrier protein) synthase II [Kluyvera cryocrescens]